MAGESVQVESRSIWVRHGRKRKLKGRFRELWIKVQICVERARELVLRDARAVVVEEPVIRERIEHWTWRSDCLRLSS